MATDDSRKRIRNKCRDELEDYGAMKARESGYFAYIADAKGYSKARVNVGIAYGLEDPSELEARYRDDERNFVTDGVITKEWTNLPGKLGEAFRRLQLERTREFKNRYLAEKRAKAKKDAEIIELKEAAKRKREEE